MYGGTSSPLRRVALNCGVHVGLHVTAKRLHSSPAGPSPCCKMQVSYKLTVCGMSAADAQDMTAVLCVAATCRLGGWQCCLF